MTTIFTKREENNSCVRFIKRRDYLASHTPGLRDYVLASFHARPIAIPMLHADMQLAVPGAQAPVLSS